jgi:hypothetical protein
VGAFYYAFLPQPPPLKVTAPRENFFLRAVAQDAQIITGDSVIGWLISITEVHFGHWYSYTAMILLFLWTVKGLHPQCGQKGMKDPTHACQPVNSGRDRTEDVIEDLVSLDG